MELNIQANKQAKVEVKPYTEYFNIIDGKIETISKDIKVVLNKNPEANAIRSKTDFYIKSLQDNAVLSTRITGLVEVVKKLEEQNQALEDEYFKVIEDNKGKTKELKKYQQSIFYQIERFILWITSSPVRYLRRINVIKKNDREKLKVFKKPSAKISPYLEDFKLTNVFDPSKGQDSHFLVSKIPTWFSSECINSEYIDIEIAGQIHDVENGPKEKLLLLRVRFFDKSGEYIEGSYPDLVNSASVGHYKYLEFNSEVFQARVHVPKNASIIALGVQSWQNQHDIFIKNEPIITHEKREAAAKKNTPKFKDGVSIIMPSYSGLKTIGSTLESIVKQDISKELIQLVVVVNGKNDGTFEYVKDFSEKNNNVEVICKYTKTPGASNARNVAVKLANRQYTVFLDDDDLIGDNFISELYRHADEDSMVVTGIFDFKKEGDFVGENSINQQVLKASTIASPNVNDVSSAVTMIASKLVPTHQIKKLEFDTNLKSGEDVVYFTDYVTRFTPSVKVLSPNRNNSYLRRLRDNSVSRREMSFDFYVCERLDVISSLIEVLNNNENKTDRNFILSKIRAQFNFIKNYLKSFPEDIDKVKDEIRSKKVGSTVYPIWNYNKADTLAISYCFAPFVDTSAVVAAKRLREFGDICDVVYNDMSKNREKSEQMDWLAEDLIERKIEIKTPTSFGGWKAIELFSQQVLDKANDKKYKKVYSRALWPASHFAAFLYKVKNPHVKWIAEFSDPVMWDLDGKQRHAKIENGLLKDEIFNKLGKKRIKLTKKTDLYYLCELLPYVFADEVIFTCNNQVDYMLEKFPNKDVAKRVKKKAVVKVHPTLPEKFYDLTVSDYKLDINKVNIGYFGAFYESRGVCDVFKAISSMSKSEKDKVQFHIFTNTPDKVREYVDKLSLDSYVNINGYIGYFEFLNISKKMNVLLVNDADVSNLLGSNPYQPSKLSDYIGSNNRIWAICDSGSALSMSDHVTYKSNVNSLNSIKATLANIANI